MGLLGKAVEIVEDLIERFGRDRDDVWRSLKQSSQRAGELARLDYTPAWRPVAVYLAAATKQRFASGVSPDGAPWAPLAHPRPRGGTTPLRDTGLLMASVTGQGQGHVEQATPQQLVWGTNLDRAALHQWGGVVRPKGRALAIPLTVEAVRAGRARQFPRPLFVHQAGGGKPFLAESVGQGKRKRLVLHYLLTASVTVPARPFVGLNNDDVEEVGGILADHAARWLTA